MKKILLLFSAVGMLSLTGCNNDDYDEDTIAEVFEISNVDFNTNNIVNPVTIPLTPSIKTSEMLLVYRLAGVSDNGDDIWEPLPATYHFDNGTDTNDFLSYYFDFTVNDLVVYLESNFNITELQNAEDFIDNQVFRIVIIPGYGSNFRTSASSMEQFKDYNAVIKKYGIDDSNVKKLNYK